MLDISIIIVSWNAKKYLEQCIASIIGETIKYQTEIIVVDNASTDGSVELVKGKFPKVKVICNDTNLGFAKANNIGIKQGTGKYICLINSDVEILQGCFDRIVPYFEQHSKIGVIGPQIIGVDGTVQRSCMGFPTIWNTFCRALLLDTLFPRSRLFSSYLRTFQKHDTIQYVDVINGCFWLISREALNQVGLLDERFFIYAEDKDWCKRFWDAGWKVVYFPQAQAIHYGGASSSNAPTRFYIEMYRANYEYWKKYHSRPAQLTFLLITGLHHIIRLIGEMMLLVIRPSKRSYVLNKIKRSIALIQWLLSFNLENRISYDI